ncbi:MAG: hypothetical protein O8C66_05145 [Candidatus Methanoperedens sp.]|nr:hypothetical protein [Candidatus Methanoperedens sp.]MCZ7369876.1 hypothetical protein [Candidatus Methanoperedens sp.]
MILESVYLKAIEQVTGKKYHDIEIDDDYIAAFNNSIKEEIERQSTGGRVDFNRLYYIGKK